MPRLDQAELATLFVFLVESIILLGVVAAGLGYLCLRYRRQLAERGEERSTDSADRDGYASYLQSLVQALVRRFRTRWSGNPAELHRNRYLQEADSPEVVAVQLRYTTLNAELSSLEGDPEGYWTRRREHFDTLMSHWDAAEKVLRRTEERLRNQSSEGVASEKRRAEETERELNNRLRQHELRAQKLEQRVAELEPYRRRFNTLHQAAEAQRASARELESQLAPLLADRPDDHPARTALKGFRQTRSGLERYLDRPDIAPFSAIRPAGDDSAATQRQAARDERMADGMEREGQRRYERLRNTLRHQQGMISDLQQRVSEAEFEKERLRQYYTVQLRKLEESVQQGQVSLEEFNKEKLRYGRQVRRLMKQLEKAREDQASVASLEQAVDRFSAQTFDMQSRIQTLEKEVAALSEENLRLQERDDPAAEQATE